MTTTQMNAISSPANGLMVYNTTTKSFWQYNGTSWHDNNLGSGNSDWDNNNIAYIPNNTFVNTDYNSETTPKNITINFFINF